MRPFLPLAVPMLLFACHAATPTAAPEPGAAASSSTPPADSATPPKPRPLRKFGDWAVGCDNGATCQAGSLVPDEGEPPALAMTIERAPGPDGAVAIRLRGDPPALPLTASIDGEAVARGGAARGGWTEWTGPAAAALVRRSASGQSLTLADASGRSIAVLSLNGLAAALRWIDARQGRDGTSGAIVATGPRPDRRPAPALPVVRAPVIRGESALIDPLLVTQMRTAAQCARDDLPDVATKPLGEGRTLAIVPCTAGAYNLLSAVFVIQRGAAIPATFDLPPAGDAPDEQTLVFNADFADGILSSFARDRGLGDCGTTQRYAWDGMRFRLIEQRKMDECRGNIDFIRTWTAKVIR